LVIWIKSQQQNLDEVIKLNLNPVQFHLDENYVPIFGFIILKRIAKNELGKVVQYDAQSMGRPQLGTVASGVAKKVGEIECLKIYFLLPSSILPNVYFYTIPTC
jgi:hypothetical protein